MSLFEPFLAFEASAGSGKTFNLVVRYLGLLFMGEEPSQITALTFTNKAANEMKERVIETLRSLETRGELAEIVKMTGLESEEIVSMRDTILWKLLRSDVKISTIDTFFGTILRKFALNAGIMPTFQSATMHHEQKFLKRFLHEIEVSGEMDELTRLSLLSSKRLDDIFELLSALYAKHKEFDALVIPQIVLSFNPYTLAMERADELSQLVLSKPISERARKTMCIEDYDDLLSKSWIFKPSLEYWDFKKVFEPKMDVLLHEIQEVIQKQMALKEAEFLNALHRILRSYIKSRRALIAQNNELTFDDITLMVHELLRGNLESEFLYFRLDATMKHLLLDEFQDTSTIQFDILRPLIEEIRSGKGVNEGGSFFFVGDVKQSIYRFRGGVSALFYEVAHHFDVKVQPLEVNYRSRSQVVEFVNRVFGEKMNRYIPQRSPAEKEGGFVEVHQSDEPLQTLFEQIEILRSEGVSADDMAILCVTNADAAKAQEYLEERGLSVVSEATSKLVHQRSVRAVIDYLRYCYFGADIYGYNCAALLGIEPGSVERDIIVDVQKQAVDFISKHSIGDKSAMMFVEKLSNFRDIEEVVYEIQRLEASSPQSDLHGIRIMTVHKSKGLEFEHVLILDRLGQARSRSESIVYEYDGMALARMFYRIKGREELDEVYKRALAKEKELEKEDQLNALYVALTRAVQSLTIIAKPKGSWLEPLELTAESYGSRAFEVSDIPMPKALRVFDFKSRAYGSQGEVVVLNDEVIVDYDAVQFGLATHYALEMMGDMREESVHNALESTRKRYGMSIPEGRLGSVRSSLEYLVRDEIFAGLTRGNLYKEQRFFYRNQMRIIDLLVEHEEGYWVIVDYKTGEQMSHEHHEQVRTYMEATRTFVGAEVRGYLCYLNQEGVQWQKVE